jgi:hypothetical protein
LPSTNGAHHAPANATTFLQASSAGFLNARLSSVCLSSDPFRARARERETGNVNKTRVAARRRIMANFSAFVMRRCYAIAASPGRHERSDPNGIRTRVTAVKGRCPRPLDDRVTKPPNIPFDSRKATSRCFQPPDVRSTISFAVLAPAPECVVINLRA